MYTQLRSLDNITSGKPDSRLEFMLSHSLIAVLRGAQEGDLPLFAWTLGLSQPHLLNLLSERLPELDALEPMIDTQYDVFLKNVPTEFNELFDLLRSKRSKSVSKKDGELLSRIITAACFGNRRLWQDMGLSSRDEISELIATVFPQLYQNNSHNLKWKRFLFSELARSKGVAELRPPGCPYCDQYLICFPK